MRFSVVNTGPLQNPYAQEMLAKIGAEYDHKPCWSEDEIIETARGADAVISSPFDPYSRKVIESLDRCRAISNMGVGYDKIDVDAATGHGVCVCYVPDYCMDEVAEHSMALILTCARRVTTVNNNLKQEKLGILQPPWVDGPVFRLRGQTLGIVGFGRIGRTVVRKAQGFGLKVIAYDPYIPPTTVIGYDVELVKRLDQLLKRSDFVSPHVPLTHETASMFGPKQFKTMKPTAYFINTARGGIVDEEALRKALIDRDIAGAAVDVMEPELNLKSPLLKLDNFLYTGHSAFYSETSGPELRRRAVQEVIRVLQGKWPQGWVNPQVKKKFIARWRKGR
ncbi:MAG: C-terminal binding protein [Dehalococcoidia bacterium]